MFLFYTNNPKSILIKYFIYIFSGSLSETEKTKNIKTECDNTNKCILESTDSSSSGR